MPAQISKQIALSALSVAAAVTLAACATNPATGESEFSLMSEAQEVQLGKEMDPQIRQQMGVYQDAELQRYVSEVGLRLARASERPSLPWQFTVVDEPAVTSRPATPRSSTRSRRLRASA